MIITKRDIIQKLYDIEEKENLKLGREVQKVVRNEIIPLDVIKFINNYDKEFFQIYSTFNIIYNSRNKNPLYRNLRNKNLPIEEIAIAISSLITKILISISKIEDNNEKLLFAKAMNLEELNESIIDYSVYQTNEKLLQKAKEIRELLEILYKD